MTPTDSPPRPVVMRELAAEPAPRAVAPVRRVALSGHDDWPHTTRVLPWLIAGFLAMLWLVPFNTIMLHSSGPIDLQLDRLALPIIAAVWVMSIALGGREAPQLRITAAHVAFIAFVLLSALSIVVNARSLNFTRELGGSVKQLSLLLAYLLFFVMITSIVRRSEVRAFLKFTFWLAIICAVGTIWEYHTSYNVFYGVTNKLPGALFTTVDLSNVTGVDEIGRRLTRGPAQIGLEVTAMLAMALPIAIVALLNAKRRGERIWYALAICLILAATLSTYKKTALIAPVTAIAVLVAFRPRRLLRLAPLGLVVLVIVHALSPGALGSVLVQLGPQRFHAVSTVNDRTNDYDAVRPDFFTHPILGRGFGAYSKVGYRILDNEVLGLLVMVGAVGVAAFVAVMFTVIAVARRPIRIRDPISATPALVAAAAAAVFLVVSLLFDSMAFPHAPYVFLSLAGLAAASYQTQELQQS
jgi:hypothetical protein